MSDFSSLGLADELMQAVEKLGFTTPTPVQSKAIPEILSSQKDFVVLAGTGTGKTAAFGLPLLQKLDPAAGTTQALILSPTRELCCQITEDLKRFSAFLPRVSICAVYGGASIGTQIRELKRNPRIVVATPGRLIDHLSRGTIDLSDIRSLVLDEADEMLSMGFREELETILASVPRERQTCLFSATMPRAIRAITSEYLQEPQEISALSGEKNSVNVQHTYLVVDNRDRYEALSRFIAKQPEFYGIVFCRTREQTRDVADRLTREGLSTDALHGELSQQQRDYVMQRFRNRTIRILVATDVAARGIDVDDLSHVVHYELPHDAESYVHRSGRTGRAGKQGVSLAISTPRDGYKIRSLERHLRKDVRRIGIPTGNEILTHQITAFVDSLVETDYDSALVHESIRDASERLAHLSREELIERLLVSQFREQIEYYRDRRDLKVSDSRNERAPRGRFDQPGGRRTGRQEFGRDERRRGPRERDNEAVDYAQVKIGMGREEGTTKSELMGLANRAMKGMRFPIGEIRLQKNSATIEVPREIAGELARRIEGSVVVRKSRRSA